MQKSYNVKGLQQKIFTQGSRFFSTKGNLIKLLLIASGKFTAKLKRIIKSCCHPLKKQWQSLGLIIQQGRKKHQLRTLPWYLILGTPHCGKKALISNLGLYFTKPKHFGDDAENMVRQYPDFDWWLSEQGVFIDVMSAIKDEAILSWRRLVKTLKRERKRKPINGVLLCYALTDIMLYSNQKRQEFIQDLCLYVRDIHLTFKVQVPVYIVFTKCDLVEGFIEFFNHLSKEQLNQVWGMTFPLSFSDESQKVLRGFHEEYNALVTRLREQVLWAMDAEPHRRGRELIHNFPQQMQLLKNPIELFLSEFFSAIRFPKALHCRGLYFTSSLQKGEPQDFLLHAMSKKFQLVPPVVKRPQRLGEAYFLKRLFHEVIYPEAQILGESERSKKLRQTVYHGLRFSAPVILVLVALALHQGYRGNLSRLKEVSQKLRAYQQLKHALNPNGESLLPLLPMLNQMKQASYLYHERVPFTMACLYETHVIRQGIQAALERNLSHLFLPRIAAQIEQAMNRNIVDQNVLYATLKGYLAFSAIATTDSQAIKAPMEYYWHQKYYHNQNDIKQLQYYLNLALAKPPAKLPLDGELISRIRGQLEQIIPSKRAYGLLQLKAEITGTAPLILSSAVGQNFTAIFERGELQQTIPALYTHTGFRTMFLKQYLSIAKEVAQDNQEIGLSHKDFETESLSQIVQAMQRVYEKRYRDHWDQALNNLRIKTFTNLNQAIQRLQVLIGKNSPLTKLFAIVYDNTQTVHGHGVNVKAYFKKFNGFQQGGKGVSWRQIQKQLMAVRNYLIQIQRSPDPIKAEYQATLATIQGKHSPILRLRLLARQTPQPIRRWLSIIAKNAWHLLVLGTHQRLNDLWQQTVIPPYNRLIAGRYPVVVHAKSNITINAFNYFFGKDGPTMQYFRHYLKPFIKTDSKVWKVYRLDSYSIEVPSSHIALFHQVVRIQQQYFTENAKEARLGLAIKPLTLDARASRIDFTVGHQVISYRHGPPYITHIIWPFPQDNQQASIVIWDFKGQRYVKTLHGPWSIFKLFTEGHFQQEHLGQYIFQINLHGKRASFEIIGPRDRNLYLLRLLKGFNLPNNIA